MTDDEYKEYIKKYFRYENGIITRNDRRNANGSLNRDGYLMLKIKGKKYLAHRLAWFLCYGYFPKSELDHINRIRTDNRIENLREATRMEQIINSKHPINKETGVRGVYIDHCTKGLKKKYTTRIKNQMYRFYTLEDAVNFRKERGYWV